VVKLQLLSPERSKSIEIVLGKLKLPIALICKSLLNFDILSPTVVESLIGICPADEEIKLLHDFEGDKSALG
jgi:hypothetical protein